MICLSCNKNPAEKSPVFGMMPCSECRARQEKLASPYTPHEFVPERIREDRKEFAPDLLQPRRNGYVSKEYLEVHGTKGLNATKEEIAKARTTNNDLHYYKQ